MIIVAYFAESFLEVETKSSRYLYSQVTPTEYDKIKRFKARGWIGKVWAILKEKPFDKINLKERNVSHDSKSKH